MAWANELRTVGEVGHRPVPDMFISVSAGVCRAILKRSPNWVRPYSTTLVRPGQWLISTSGFHSGFAESDTASIAVVGAFAIFHGHAHGVELPSSANPYAYATGFVTQLWMYASPVVYPFSQAPEKYKWIFYFNPMTAPIESLRSSMFGTAGVNWDLWLMNLVVTSILVISGLILFSRAESTAMDTV